MGWGSRRPMPGVPLTLSTRPRRGRRGPAACAVLGLASILAAATLGPAASADTSSRAAAPGAIIRAADEAEWAASSCADVIVYVVRGSGELPQTGAGAAPYNASNPAAGYTDTWDAFDPIDPETGGSSIDADRVLDRKEDGSATVDTHTPFLYDLVQKVHERVGGQVRLSWAPIRYPAVPVEQGAWVKVGLWALHGYPNSVTSGIRELNRTLHRQWETCGTRTRYVLAGYSQGADVVNSYLRGKIIVGSSTFGLATAREFLGPTPEIAQQIAAVELIGDPNHDPADPESYTDLDPRLAHRGGLYGFRAGVPEPVGSVTDSFCLDGDPVCGQGLQPDLTNGPTVHGAGYRDFVDHPVACHLDPETPVTDESAITCAADRIVWRLGVRNLIRSPPSEAPSAPGSTGRDVAFFVDTTGSMTDDIDSAIQFAANQADRIVSLDGRVALVQYRDSDDGVPVEVVTGFTSDIYEFEQGLRTLVADGGGDTPEGLLHALMVGFDELDWQYGASKAAVVLTDAGFHEPDRTGGETLPLVERRSLQIDPVNVFPVVDTVRQYGDLAARTSGEVIMKGSGSTELALDRALDNIADRPVAALSNGTYVSSAGRAVHFDASASTAIVGDLAEYRWDVDGDGFTDEVTDEPTFDHTYPAGYAGVMQVLVVDEMGRSSNASASVLVTPNPTRGLVTRVPGASAMSADAVAAEDHVTLDVDWAPGADTPARWVVSIDGDPVDVAEGTRNSTRVEVPYQDEPWQVSVVGMDTGGNYGPAFTARLEPLPDPPAWYQRPVVWGAGVLGGLGGFALVWLLLRRRRVAPSSGPPIGQG